MTGLLHHRKLLWAALAIGIVASPGCTGKGERKDEVTTSRAAPAASAPARVASSREIEEIIDGWRAKNDNAPLIEHRFYYDNAGSYHSFVELPSRADATIIVTSTEQARIVSATPLHVDQLHGAMVFAAIPPATFEAIRSYTLGRVDYQLRHEISGKPPSGIVGMHGFALEDVKGNVTANILNQVPIHGVGLTDLKEGTLVHAIEQSFVSGVNSTKVTSIGNLMQNATAAIYASPDASLVFEKGFFEREKISQSNAGANVRETEPVGLDPSEFYKGGPPSPAQAWLMAATTAYTVTDMLGFPTPTAKDVVDLAVDVADTLIEAAFEEGEVGEIVIDIQEDGTQVWSERNADGEETNRYKVDQDGNVTEYVKNKDGEWVEKDASDNEDDDEGSQTASHENEDPDTPPPSDDTGTMPSDPDAEPCDPRHYACELGEQLGSYVGPGEVEPPVEGHLGPLILPPGPDDPGGGDGSQAGTPIKEDPGSLILPPGPDDPGGGDSSQAGTPIKEDPGSLILPPGPDDPGGGDGSQPGTPIKGDPGPSIPPPVPDDATPGTIATTVGSRRPGTGLETPVLQTRGSGVLQEERPQKALDIEKELSRKEAEQWKKWQESGGGSPDSTGSTRPKPRSTPRAEQRKPGEESDVYEPKIPTQNGTDPGRSLFGGACPPATRWGDGRNHDALELST